MKDTLRTEIPVIGGTASALGLITVSDNHGNSTQGAYLKCKAMPSLKMKYEEWKALHTAIEHTLLPFKWDGEVSLPDGQESPLKTLCNRLHRAGTQKSVPKR